MITPPRCNHGPENRRSLLFPCATPSFRLRWGVVVPVSSSSRIGSRLDEIPSPTASAASIPVRLRFEEVS